MSTGRRPRPIILPLLLAVSGALLVWLAFQGWAAAIERRGVAPAALNRIVVDLQRVSDDVLTQAGAIATAALEGSVWAAEESAASGALAPPRLEGVGVLDADGTYLNWRGAPVEPDEWLVRREAPRWIVRADGIRTRLIVRAGPDPFGFVALASFILDSTPGDATLRELLPDERRNAVVRLHFIDTRDFYDDVWLSPPERRQRTAQGDLSESSGAVPGSALRSPDGDVLLATVDVDPVAPGLRARRIRAAGEAWAATVLILLAAVLLPWRRLARGGPGFVALLAALAGGRALLLVTEAPLRLLPREAGSPSLFGRTDLAGLLASPADLLLTCLALALIALAVRSRLVAAGTRGRWWSTGLAAGAAVLATLLVWTTSVSLAVHARVQLLDFEKIGSRQGPALLLLAWVVLIVAAAVLWGTVWNVARPRLGGLVVSEHAPALLAVIPLSLLAAFSLQSVGERLALERLRLEFAPEVLNQASYRRVALLSAVRQAAAEIRSMPPAATGDPRTERLAFRLWYGSDLFHAGYRSSLDVFDAEGQAISSFGFDLPPVIDEAFSEPPESDSPIYREEVFPVGALPQRLLHAEIAVERQDGEEWVIVGHVLQEAANLPFLAAAEPYLAALGAEAPRRGAAGEPPTPEYVLYDRRGSVLLRTVDQPPTLTREMEMAATQESDLRLRAGEDSYVGVPLLDGDLLHLLMMRSPSPVERLGAAARLALLAMALITGSILLAGAARPNVAERLARALRGSFYRKLLLTLLLASVLPLVGLSLFVRGYIESRATATVVGAAVRYVSVAQRVVEDFLVAEFEQGGSPELDDNVLHWLRRLVGQEIHVYREGRLVASSKRELFTSGLLPVRLPGAVQEELVRVGLPYLVLPTRLGDESVPVAYAPLTAREVTWVPTGLVVAVPLTVQRDDISRPVDLVVEMLLLATVALAGALALIAASLARTVARPVRDLVGATGRIAAGDYSARLETHAKDEIADLVEGFNAMASSLAAQRADLERRRDYMEALLRNATTGVVSTDTEGRIVTVNPAMAALSGIPPEELEPGTRLVEILERHADLGPVARTLRRPAAELREPHEIDLERDGRARRFRVVRVDLPDPHGGAPGSLYLMDDVTELMRSNQLAAWAEMARAIAHEIKNPLTPIQLSTEHLRRLLHDRGVSPEEEIDSCIETVMKQVRALHQIAAEFSTYAKLPALALEPRDPVEFMRETVAPYRSAPPPNVRIDERYTDAPQVNIDRRVLSRAVINLVENALHAMPEGGVLTVSVEVEQGSRVTLGVADTGTGLGPGVRARLFEPYFSTKTSGTGLGLAIVQRAVEAHHGTIEVQSERGRGTTFRVRLPAADRSR